MKSSHYTIHTPEDALHVLREGHQRFLRNESLKRPILDQVRENADSQEPFAIVLSCIDSRIPVEIIFDQGIGDIMSVRVAGNVVNEDVVASLEFACAVLKARLILVMGHSRCGAVESASTMVQMGRITGLLEKIKPALLPVGQGSHSEGSFSESELEAASYRNVQNSIDQVREESDILREMEEKGDIIIRGAFYHVEDGQIDFLGS